MGPRGRLDRDPHNTFDFLMAVSERHGLHSAFHFLANNDVRMMISRRSSPMPFTFRNADCDEVYFVHEGSGRFETDYGVLAYERGDYIVIPRGTNYRVIPDTSENYFLITEATGEVNAPSKEIKGLIGQHALYDPAVITTPYPRR